MSSKIFYLSRSELLNVESYINHLVAIFPLCEECKGLFNNFNPPTKKRVKWTKNTLKKPLLSSGVHQALLALSYRDIVGTPFELV